MLSGPFFELPSMAVQYLKQAIRTYHGIFQENKLTGNELEEALYNALGYDPLLHGHLRWNSGSHNSKADIWIDQGFFATEKIFTISVKSGTLKQKGSQVQISGHRLSAANSNMNTINLMLRDRISDIMICFVHHQKLHTYEVFYIDAPIFDYPQSGDAWKAFISPKKGVVTSYSYTSPRGMFCEITPSQSWQIWWRIPMDLCRQGPTISYSH